MWWRSTTKSWKCMASIWTSRVTSSHLVRRPPLPPASITWGLVVCGLKSAYVQRSDKPFLDEVGKYYAALSIVDDLHEVLELRAGTVRLHPLTATPKSF